MKFSWISYNKTDKKCESTFNIYQADSEIVGAIRSCIIDRARMAFQHGNYAEARELLKKVEDIDEEVGEACDAEKKWAADEAAKAKEDNQ